MTRVDESLGIAEYGNVAFGYYKARMKNSLSLISFKATTALCEFQASVVTK